MDEYINTDMCSQCGGECCKHLPGCAMPEDFGLPDTHKLIDALKSSNWAIDWWEGDEPLYFIRPSIKGYQGRLFDPSWGGECIFLTAQGCKLSHDKRPSGCRLLEPDKPHCKIHGADKYASAIAWQEYNLKNIGEALEATE